MQEAKKVPTTKFRNAMPQIVRDAIAGVSTIITKHKRPVAIVMPYTEPEKSEDKPR